MTRSNKVQVWNEVEIKRFMESFVEHIKLKPKDSITVLMRRAMNSSIPSNKRLNTVAGPSSLKTRLGVKALDSIFQVFIDMGGITSKVFRLSDGTVVKKRDSSTCSTADDSNARETGEPIGMERTPGIKLRTSEELHCPEAFHKPIKEHYFQEGSQGWEPKDNLLNTELSDSFDNMVAEVRENVDEYVEQNFIEQAAQSIAAQVKVEISDMAQKIITRATDIVLANLIGLTLKAEPEADRKEPVMVSLPDPIAQDKKPDVPVYFIPTTEPNAVRHKPFKRKVLALCDAFASGFRIAKEYSFIQVQCVGTLAEAANPPDPAAILIYETSSFESVFIQRLRDSNKFAKVIAVKGHVLQITQCLDKLEDYFAAIDTGTTLGSKFGNYEGAVLLQDHERRPMQGASIQREKHSSVNGVLLEDRFVLRYNGDFIDADFRLDRLRARTAEDFTLSEEQFD